jgi:imidazoleglycerol-phosphate dehydratase
MSRKAFIKRETKETDVEVKLDLDGKGQAKISTPVGFLSHMLELLARHGRLDLEVTATGDVDVDFHHTVEDVGLVLGQVLGEATGDKSGMARYGFASVPMDEALAEVTVDFGGRPFLVFNAPELKGRIGDFDAELIEEFFRALANKAGINLHIELRYGSNLHHMAEAIFKAAARAINVATRIPGDIDGVLSTKGSL